MLRRWFNGFIGIEKEDGSSGGLFYLFLVAGVSTTVIFAVAGLIMYSEKEVAYGTFGDFIGGTLNPVLTFLTFMGLLITIVLQQTELRDTREELAKSATALEAQSKAADRQNFENTFFQMLSLHNTIVNSIDLYYSGRKESMGIVSDKGPRETRGRDCFKQFFENFQDQYTVATGPTEKDRLQAAYDVFWDLRQQDLAHYYRYLYNVLRFVFEYEGKIDKQRYVKLLRAQLSDFELALLFYTALNAHGINYWLYIHEYRILDNMPDSVFIHPTHKSLFSPQSFGEPKAAPNSSWPPAQLAADYEALKAKSVAATP
ncbi:putative phage abortive infection protein [Agrobacterium tumefaciens]|uniref:putative phage abortive infection protein n=1 Tax=Agrobacterium tumefaciens TaxID=358 RepID=UPI0021FE1D4E|nr:hypothetical protein FY143_22995 [Agrobacterium tumefaciens]UXT84389.1 hypothetical protein FY131_22875 [Agrobacterium tumefaciens]